MRRREFITLLGGAAVIAPQVARAQQGERVRRIGVLAGSTEDDSETRAMLTALREGLAKLGWVEGRNLRLTLRFGAGNADRMRDHAAELVGASPDVIVTTTGASTRAVQRATQSIPIGVTGAGDAVASGVVPNMTRPEAKTNGFRPAERSLA